MRNYGINDYEIRKQESRYPSTAITWKMKHGGNGYPGAMGKREINTYIKILTVMGIKSEIKLKPHQSIPNLAISNSDEIQRDFNLPEMSWCMDLEMIESYMVSINRWTEFDRLWYRMI